MDNPPFIPLPTSNFHVSIPNLRHLWFTGQANNIIEIIPTETHNKQFKKIRQMLLLGPYGEQASEGIDIATIFLSVFIDVIGFDLIIINANKRRNIHQLGD